MNKQSKLDSFVESILNTAIGYLFAVAGQLIIFPYYGLVVDMATNIKIGLFFTVISIVRGYGIRRLFNRWNVSKVISNIIRSVYATCNRRRV